VCLLQLNILHCSNLPDHIVENSSMFEISQLQVRIKPHDHGELFASISSDINSHPWSHFFWKINVKLLPACQTQTISCVSGLILKRNDAHSNKIAAMYSLVAFCNDCLDTEEEGSLGCPISAGSTSVIFARQDDEISSSLGILLGSIKNVQNIA